MKRIIRQLTFICFLGFAVAGKASGQSAQTDTSRHALANVISYFYLNIGQQSRLYDGHEYIGYDPHIKGNALYPLDAQTWALGKVTYDGFVYKNVPMMYDIYKDVLVALLYNHFSSYALLSERVSDFSFSGHHFVRVNADALVNDKSGITTGFYDQLYGGRTEVLAKRVKTVQNSTNQTLALETYFIEANDYYIRKGGAYYKVSGQGSFLNLLKDKKPELQKYIKDSGFKFRTDPELAMARLAAYYDQITK
ncbi:MAG: hypothetical protein JSU01_19160 [Bacteroidetes bacterium]|nr:hypothetical protein [Bacteroidota bacterium]